jgi:putative flippase GtrA
MLSGRVLWFIAVGAAAAAVHFAVVVALASLWHWRPLLANPAGWAVALVVSYSGHRRLTFGDANAPWARSLRRFFVVSALGFIVNQTAYALLLTQGGVEYRVALAAVLIAVAAATFMASRHWAFLGTQARPPHRATPPTTPDRG